MVHIYGLLLLYVHMQGKQGKEGRARKEQGE